MTVYLLIISFFSLAYLVRIVIFYAGLARLDSSMVEENCSHPYVSVVIPFRNEGQGLPGLLRSLKNQEYPADRFEILLVNDHSEDQGRQLITSNLNEQLHARVIDLGQPGGKNAAIREGIRNASHELILTMDADVRCGPQWLKSMTCFYRKKQAEVVIGPVLFERNRTFWKDMLALEFLSLSGVTAGTAGWHRPLMGSGANMMFNRQSYLEYMKGNRTETASGDDVFFILWVKRRSRHRIHYNPSVEALVTTPPTRTLTGFLSQRLRWTSKSRHYRDPDILATSLIVYLFHVLLLCSVIAGLFHSFYLLASAGMFLLKSVVDLIFLLRASRLFNNRTLIRYFLPVQLIYPLYVVTAGTLGHFHITRWKGRRI